MIDAWFGQYDTCYATTKLAKFCIDPGEVHFEALLWVMGYILPNFAVTLVKCILKHCYGSWAMLRPQQILTFVTIMIPHQAQLVKS
jgi:hypothetical protein